MASIYSFSLSAPSFSKEPALYVPRASKPKLKSKAKSMSTAKTAEYRRLEVGTSKDDGELFHIDDFSTSDLNTSRSFNYRVATLLRATDGSSLQDYSITRLLNITS